jgi:hypothetical protein
LDKGDIMSKIFSFSGLILIILMAAVLNARDVDVTGDWELIMETPRGEMTRAIRFEQDGETLTVSMEGMRGNKLEGKGTLKGDKIEWAVSRDTPQGEFTISFTGTVEGDTMSGTADMAGRRTIDWTARRV